MSLTKSYIINKNKQGRKCYCLDRNKNKSSFLESTNDLAVASLPHCWVPKKGSDILIKYLNNTKLQYEGLINHMNDNCIHINNDINSRLRNLAEYYLGQVQQYEADMKQTFSNVDKKPNPEVRNKLTKRIADIRYDHEQEVKHFKHEAMLLERERGRLFKIMVRDIFQQIVATGYRTPRDLLHEFDKYIYEINQQLLSNTRTYIDMDLYLHSHTYQWHIYARSGLNQILITDLPLQSQRSYSASIADIQRRSREVSIRSRSTLVLQPSGIKKHSSGGSLTESMASNNDIESCLERLLEVYRMAVTKVLTGFSGTLNLLFEDIQSKSLAIFNNLNTFNELQDVIERVLKKLSQKIAHKCSLLKTMGGDGQGLQNCLRMLGERLRETYTILYEAAHLWDFHILRAALAQKLTMVAVEDLLTNNDSVQLANDMTFNILLENLRQGSEIDKLQQQFDTISAQLDQIANVYITHRNAEIDKLQQFMKLLPALTATVLAEINCFFEKHPCHTEDIKLNTSETTLSNLTRGTALEILSTEMQVQHLLNWKNCFIETMIFSAKIIPEELIARSQQWVKDRAAILHMRYSMKMISHSVRLERVRVIFDLRMAQLKYHEQRLTNHTEAVNQMQHKVEEEITAYLDFANPELYPFFRWTDDITQRMAELDTDDIDKEVKKMKMSSYNLRLIKHQKLFADSLEEALTKIRQRVQRLIQEARIANVNFLSEIKLFSEGGQYNALEAGRAMTVLTQCSEQIENTEVHGWYILDQQRTSLLNQVEECLLPLQKIIGDVLPKPGGRSADKKDAPKKK